MVGDLFKYSDIYDFWDVGIHLWQKLALKAAKQTSFYQDNPCTSHKLGIFKPNREGIKDDFSCLKQWIDIERQMQAFQEGGLHQGNNMPKLCSYSLLEMLCPYKIGHGTCKEVQ